MHAAEDQLARADVANTSSHSARQLLSPSATVGDALIRCAKHGLAELIHHLQFLGVKVEAGHRHVVTAEFAIVF